jgi:hypothetical protein
LLKIKFVFFYCVTNILYSVGDISSKLFELVEFFNSSDKTTVLGDIFWRIYQKCMECSSRLDEKHGMGIWKAVDDKKGN